jgi:uncharacterized membrane protein
MEQPRLRLFDTIRGFSVVSMVGFHLCYDLVFLAGIDIAWFHPPLQDMWRASISWTFLLVAGCMCCFSRDNLRRAIRYGALAAGIFVATSIASVDAPINFGIIYCMAACTFVQWALQRMGCKPYGPVAACALGLCFVLCLNLSRGYVGVGPASIRLPSALFATPWLSWLGFPGPGFVSSDYYPLLPFVLLYLCGSSLGWWWKDRGFPDVFTKGFAPLEAVGRHPLEVYVAHQPILLLLTGTLW